MKIAISVSGSSLDDKLDMRFGRAQGFIIYETNDDSFEFVDNTKNMNAGQGAGIQSAQNVVDKGVEAVVTGYCGPKAYAVLEEADVKIYNAEQDTIKNIVQKFKNNELQEQAED